MTDAELNELYDAIEAKDVRVDHSDDAHALRIDTAHDIDALLIADLSEC
jgi:hypothetical protein